MYYFTDRESVAQLGWFPQHLDAKGKVARWYDRYRIVASNVSATHGDGRRAQSFAHSAIASRPDQPTD